MPIIRNWGLHVCYYRLWCAMSWLLAVEGQVQNSRLCVRAEGCCSTLVGHFYVHHQELETICVLLLPVVCSVLVAGCRRSGTGQQDMRPG